MVIWVSSNKPSSAQPSTTIEPSPPKPRPSNFTPAAFLVPRNDETLYEWVTREYFEMNKKMYINENLTIEHTLKVVWYPKRFHKLAQLAEKECDFCCKINETRPAGARKIPCIVNVYGVKCMLCYLTKKDKQDCQSQNCLNDLQQSQGKSLSKESISSPTTPSTPGGIHERTLENDNEEDMAARKRTKFSLDRESVQSRGRSESISHSSTHSKDATSTKVLQSIEKRDGKDQCQQKTQGMVNREGKETSSKPLIEGRSPTKHLKTSSEHQSNFNLEQGADFMLLETISTPTVSSNIDSTHKDGPQEGGRKSIDSTERSISPNTSNEEGVDVSLLADRSDSTSATKEKTPPEDADEGDSISLSEVLKPITLLVTQKDQKISKLKTQINDLEVRLKEEKLINQNHREIIKGAERIKQKAEEEQKSIKAERERTRLKVGYLIEEKNNLVIGNEKLMGRCRAFEVDNEKCKGRNEALKVDNEKLMGQNKELKVENEKLMGRNKELEEKYEQVKKIFQ